MKYYLTMNASHIFVFIIGPTVLQSQKIKSTTLTSNFDNTKIICIIYNKYNAQILSGLLSLSLNLMMDRKMEETRNEYAMEWVGRVRLSLSFIVFLDNILIAAFDPMGLALLLQYDAALVENDSIAMM